MNLNKLFPRLPIRTKLAIAFVTLAGLPIGLLAFATVQITLTRLRKVARETLQSDLENTARQVEARLAGTARDASFLAAGLLDRAVHGAWEPPPEQVAALNSFAATRPELLRVLVIRAEGTVAALLDHQGLRLNPREDQASGVYYDLRASHVARGEWLALPVEVLAGPHGSATAPAIAVLAPVHDRSGAYVGVIALEVFAGELFAGIEAASPYLTGLTALMDNDGFFLYHTERKNDWSVLLAALGDSGTGPANPDVAPREGPFAGNKYVVATSALQLGASARSLRLYRAVPLKTVNASLREFLSYAGFFGIVLVALVLALALVAAQQFTNPIYRLRRATRALATGQSGTDLTIDSNDELEDLAQDFQDMARTITEHREELERLVVARTRELAAAHAELNDILANSADAIIGLDPDGRVRLWNRGAERLFGYMAAECEGRPVDDLLLPRDANLQAEQAFVGRELERRGSVTDLHTQRRRKDGELIPVSLTHTLIRDAEGVLQGAGLIVRDTSLQVRFEEQMRRSERLATVSVLSAGLAHELNNPIGIIGNRLAILEASLAGRADAEAVRRDLAVVQEHVRRLGSITGHLLQMGRADEDAPCNVRLDEVAARATGLLERSLVTRGVYVVLQTDPAVPPVRGRDQALETVCMNLMLNAADAMPKGGTITLRSSPGPDGRVELRVVDDGPGVPKDLRERIFQPFFTTKKPGRGTGLGLALCRSIVERHGGQIHVEDAPGGGSCFVISIPAVTSEAA